MERVFFTIAAVSAFVGVAAGAFGAHGLRNRLSPEMSATFEVGVRYQMYHAFALIVVSWAQTRWPGALVIASGWLYLLSLSGARWLGAITPLGGLAFLAGWLILAWSVWRV